jgi:hypothetical protein
VIEIPLNYKERVGRSVITGSHWQACLVGMKMIGLITRFRLQTWFDKFFQRNLLSINFRSERSFAGRGQQRRA